MKMFDMVDTDMRNLRSMETKECSCSGETRKVKNIKIFSFDVYEIYNTMEKYCKGMLK